MQQWEELRPRLERLAQQRLRDHDLARDAVQEALVHGWEKQHTLRNPAALSGWLARLVLTACSRRLRLRPTVELRESLALITPELEVQAERNQQEKRLREAVERLPEIEADAITLHYFHGISAVELATLLNLPAATIRTRLHRARHRLKKELSDMDDTNLKTLYEAARQEYIAGRPVIEALSQARTALVERLELGELDYPTVAQGAHLLWRLGDSETLLRLLDAFEAQTTDPAQRYWAEGERIHALQDAGRHEEAIAAYETRLASAEAHPERLSITPDGSPWSEGKERLPTDSVPLSAALHGYCRSSWEALGRIADYEAHLIRILKRTPPQPHNRWLRFYLLRWIYTIARSEDYLERIEALATEEGHPFDAAHWRAQAACLRLKENTPDQAAGEKAIAALTEAEATLPENDEFRASKFKILRNNIGASLADAQLFALSEPLMRADVASGHANGFSYGFLAMDVWGQRKDRKETLTLIRKGQNMEPKDNFAEWLGGKAVFQDLAKDREFVSAGTP
ncbi:MAG: sigma-70 family RNA polymerase sigma factor [Armatimonas sp.]